MPLTSRRRRNIRFWHAANYSQNVTRTLGPMHRFDSRYDKYPDIDKKKKELISMMTNNLVWKPLTFSTGLKKK